MKKIPLTQGKFALVDDADFEWLNQWKWYASTDNYVVRSVTVSYEKGKQIQKKVRMHREIMKVTDDKYVDHISGNKLDNRRANLRECTNQQNQANSKMQNNNKLGYKGVYKSNSKYRARLFSYRKSYDGGTYATVEEAAKAYNELAVKHFGNFARLNEV